VDAGGRELPEERQARARAVLGDVAAGGRTLDLVWKLAPRDARADGVRLARRGQRAANPITAAVAAGVARRYLSPRNHALWAAYVLSLWPVVALTDTAWALVSVPLWVLGAALTLRTISGAKRSERINRELVDQAMQEEDPISMPASRGGFEAAFWEVIEANTPLQTAPRLHVF
jgi:hypothetical protein